MQKRPHVNTFRFYVREEEYIAIWRHIQDIFCFWIEQFACVLYSCFQTPSGSIRPVYRNKSPKILQICNFKIKGVALETSSNTFQVVLNFVNFGITGTKNTPAQYVRFKIFKSKNTCYHDQDNVTVQ
jgi:hypothetical protein